MRSPHSATSPWTPRKSSVGSWRATGLPKHPRSGLGLETPWSAGSRSRYGSMRPRSEPLGWPIHSLVTRGPRHCGGPRQPRWPGFATAEPNWELDRKRRPGWARSIALRCGSPVSEFGRSRRCSRSPAKFRPVGEAWTNGTRSNWDVLLMCSQKLSIQSVRLRRWSSLVSSRRRSEPKRRLASFRL